MADLFSNMHETDREKNSQITGIASIVFGAMSAIWSLLFSFVCGWLSWPLAFIGLILGVVSILMKKDKLGYIGLGLNIFAFIYPMVVAILFGGAISAG